MDRRSKQVVGMVNFPVDGEEYKSTNEGGMFVQLWCVEGERFSCGVCCGYGGVYSMMSEELVGTDEEVNTDNFHEIEEGKDPMEWEQSFALEEKLFPRIRKEGEHQYLSEELLACVNMGSTGWSGSNKDHDYWRCRYEDLNEAGRGIYDALKNAYPKAKLILVTWLDDSKMLDIKVWRGYIRELGMEFVDSCDDGSFCVRDPLRQEMRYISMKKELALKILFLGELP